MVTDHLAELLPQGDPADLQGYMCGPPPMIAVLTGLGVPLEAIHYDKFTDASFRPR
jgi:p-cymene monooxygenase electron transfer component